MMPEIPEHSLYKDEMANYLYRLDSALKTLAEGLVTQENKHQEGLLRAFGEDKQWDWTRLPKNEQIYPTIAKLVERIRKEYQWFAWQEFPDDSKNNQGYFEQLNINTESGLPWMYDFMQLHRLKREATAMLLEIPGFEESAYNLRTLLTSDTEDISRVKEKAAELHKKAMNRNFLEQLHEAELLGWELGKYSLPPQATRLLKLGVEELWNLHFIQYSPGSSMFEMYMIDTWQDVREPQIQEGDYGKGMVSAELQSALKFSPNNAAWFILRSIDEKFPGLHPVHVSRALVGPFENRYLTRPDEIPTLPVTRELLKENPDAGLLRFSRQYSYAPNHVEENEELRQVIHRENWSDEIIVCPGRYSSTVAKSVLGTQVRVFEM